MSIKNIQQRVRVYNEAIGISYSYSYNKFYAFIYLLQGVVYKTICFKPYINRIDRLIGILNRYE